MKIQDANCNGNVDTNCKETNSSHEICSNIRSERDLNKNSVNASIAYNNYTNITTISEEIEISGTKCNITQNPAAVNSDTIVCNNQYRINVSKIKTNSGDKNLRSIEILDDNKRTSKNLPNCTIFVNKLSVDEEQAFELSDADEMSENSVHPVPRGIINPNYPGFQHLAHTLQDYSTNIEQFEHSENDMTDDDIDADIIESHNVLYQKKTTEMINEKDGNITSNETQLSNDLYSQKTSDADNQIPDLLKTITKNNNNDILSNCTTTDIENNFHTKDIIGDFNKEIEDEIRELLNYNINIENDLQELRKDIKDTFAKPIENTINNISDVVNDVIKKLVENKVGDKTDITSLEEITDEVKSVEEDTIMREENENNTRVERTIVRPSFLLIENHMPSKIADAILSDGKEEININEYNAESLSHNVENTIKQLSTELRKIIPKLNEMRDRDKLWTENKKENSTFTDGNSNNILSLTTNEPRNCRLSLNQASGRRFIQDNIILGQKVGKLRNDSKVRQSLAKSMFKAENNLSIRRQNYEKELEYESFDVYNIETALPKLDLDAIENHIKAAKEAERRKRNDREEIRKRLAMDIETDENYYSLGHTDRPGKKPSLHSRLQNGKNLQICFMNEIASDNESQSSDIERNLRSYSSSQSSLSSNIYNHPYQTKPLSVDITKHDKASNVQCGSKLRLTSKSRSSQSLSHIEIKESDFFVLQATLQTEARIALAQAKEMARIQMERERRSRGTSPVTEMLRRSVEKACVPLDPPRRRLSRHLLTDVNITQLQVIVNELHSQIEALNDTLVKLLMARDELHMGQDSMLVDIEDLTRYLGVKEQTKKTKGTTSKSGVRRLTSLVHN